MIDSFDDIYDQIIQCERRIEEKQRLQTELRIQVQNYKDVLQRIQEDQSRVHRELTLKTEQLSTVELEHRSLTTRENVLQTQRDSLQEEQASLQARLTSLDEDVEREMMSFCQSVESHSEDLDLSTSGQRARQNKATSTLQRLIDTEQQLLRDIAEYEVHKEALAQLEADRCCQQQSLCDTAQTKKELDECLAREEETLEQLEEERQHVSKIPQCGDEFKRLRTELNSLHTGTMEEECAQLQQQVHMLQQQLHSKQQQELRHQMHQPLCPMPQQQQLLPPAQEMHGQAGGESTSAGRGSCVQGRDQGKTPPLSREPMTSTVDVMDDDDDDMTLPDLELSEAEREDAGGEGFRVCNRQKPVFKPIHC